MKQAYKKSPLSVLIPDDRRLEQMEDKITKFISNYLGFYGFKKVVIGLSGGLDSSLVAYLAARTLPTENIIGVLMPSRLTSADHIDKALSVIKNLNIKQNDFSKVHDRFNDVARFLEEMGQKVGNENEQKLKFGNIQARVRMIILRDIAKANNALVLGTTNKTEMELGYATIAGDGLGGVDLEPIAGIYKTTSKSLAHYVEVPEEIIDQTPTAELWDDQSDEEDLGITYRKADLILLGNELGYHATELKEILKAEKITPEDIELVLDLRKQNIYKTKLPPFPSFPLI